MPRTPAVYERKVKWKKYEDEVLTAEEKWRDNYPAVACAIEG